MPHRLILPTIQNWTCHNCSNCCRQNVIVVSSEEQKRIESQNWSDNDGIPQKMFTPMGRDMRLSTQADGSCVFLDERGLCKIHARFGESAKPLACRVYPFAFHPAGDEVALSLRFCCPSVVAGQGTPIQKQMSELNALAQVVVPHDAGKIPPPTITGKLFLTWDETQIIIEALAQLFAHPELPLDQKLLQADFVARMLEKTDFEKIRGDRVTELMQILLDNAAAEIIHESTDRSPLTKLVLTQFRLIIAQYARHDSFAESSRGMGYRLKMLLAGWRMARGHGNTPAMQVDLPSVSFEQILKPVSFVSNLDLKQANELWLRYFEVKLRGLHFSGRGCFDLPIVEGLQRLLLMYPVTMYLARWIAAGHNQSQLTIRHVQSALSMADHHHGYSHAMSLSNFRSLTRYIFQHNGLPGLFQLLGVNR